MGLKELFSPLAPSSADTLCGESKVYQAILVAACILSTLGTYLLAQQLQPLIGTDYVVSCTPFFFILIGVEALLLRWGAAKDSVAAQYSACDSWASIAAGTTQMIWFTFAKRYFSHALLYAYVWRNYRLFDAGESWAWCFGAFVLGDFFYYWFHRMAHEYSVLWAGHNVHHSSEHYNFSTALRQSARQALLSPFWSLPAALIFPPAQYFIASQWVTLYQFWIHTCVIRRMGLLEYVFNTPSHHRCHHDRRLHKNFAGVFIIWDRLFGTFYDEFETEESSCLVAAPPRGEIMYFGIQEVVPTWSEAATQLLLSFPRQWWKGPGYFTSTAKRILPKHSDPSMLRIRLVEELSGSAVWYLWTHFVVTLGMFILLVIWSGDASVTNEDIAVVTFFSVASLATQGLLLDGGRKPWLLELARCAVAVAMCERFGWYALSWFHVGSFATCLLAQHRVMGPGGAEVRIKDE